MTDIFDPKAAASPGGGIAPVNIEDELKRSYLDYAMSVIVSRALPDVRDGLKPVHRRILYSMWEQGNTHDKPYRKSAKAVGEVMGNYHPHGDSAIYDALVRMAQPFAMGLPLIDGQGNFGSMDGDPPAAMRYTESRLARSASDLLEDIEKDTVAFQDTYDGSRQEPVVLPAKFPNLLVNGATGIAVGMATRIPPHNLGEVVDAAVALIDDPAVEDEVLYDLVPGPDFPTGALIIGRSGSRSALMTGRGSIILRSRTEIETTKQGRTAIIVTEVPYEVNKSKVLETIAELVRDKRIEGIADLRDESDRNGVRVVIEIKRDASADVVLNNLFRLTQLQTSFPANMLALNGGRPELLSLRSLLTAFLTFREEVIANRAKFDLNKARNRAHVLIGLALAVANIDEIIRIIRYAPDPNSAREALMSKPWPAQDMGPLIALIADRRTVVEEGGAIRLSDEQARAILDLRLQRLTGLGRDEIGTEANSLKEKIADLLDLLSSRARIMEIVRNDLLAAKAAYGVPRRTEFVDVELDLEDEAFIEREDMVVTVSHGGYVKRTPLSMYRTQKRGGKGRAGMATKDEDFVTRLFSADTHTEVLFFSSTGMVYKQKVWRLPLGPPQARGKALVNILPLEADERITSVMPLPEDDAARERLDVMFVTRAGGVRRNRLADFVQVNRNGKIAMKLEEPGDSIVDVQILSDADNVLLTTKLGQCIRFAVDDVRVFTGRTSTGVRGIRLEDGDEVISLAVLGHVDLTSEEARAYLKHANAQRRLANDTGEETGDAALELVAADEEDEAGANLPEASLSPERLAALAKAEQFILTVTADGFGKRASAYDYRMTGRGGKGLIAHKLSPGQHLVASFPVQASDDLMLVTDGGQLIRCPVEGVRIAARATQGVRLIRTNGQEKVVSVERLADTTED